MYSSIEYCNKLNKTDEFTIIHDPTFNVLLLTDILRSKIENGLSNFNTITFEYKNEDEKNPIIKIIREYPFTLFQRDNILISNTYVKILQYNEEFPRLTKYNPIFKTGDKILLLKGKYSKTEVDLALEKINSEFVFSFDDTFNGYLFNNASEYCFRFFESRLDNLLEYLEKKYPDKSFIKCDEYSIISPFNIDFFHNLKENKKFKGYLLNGEHVSNEILDKYYTLLAERNQIPYDGVTETNEIIKWKWGYSGGWGLGCDGYLIYNKNERIYYLRSADTSLDLIISENLNEVILSGFPYFNIDDFTNHCEVWE